MRYPRTTITRWLASFAVRKRCCQNRKGVIVTSTQLPLPGTDKEKAMGVAEAADRGDCRVCIRGNKDQPGESVPRGFPGSIEVEVDLQIGAGQSGRLQLAQWLTDTDHPLTARVFVNRVFQHLLGTGFVRTPDNFGTRGTPPTHPELLDHLASRFMADEWSVKRLVRRTALSRVYRLSSKLHASRDLRETAMQVDPENKLHWRQNRRRLDAESIRDAILAISGRLERCQFGNTLTYTGRIDTPKSDKRTKNPEPWRRRSVYLPRYRGAYEHDLLKIFDAAHPALVTGQRNVTNVPTQALYLMNSPFLMEQAEYVALQSARTKNASSAERVQNIYRTVLGRPADTNEVIQDLALVEESRAAFDAAQSNQSRSKQPPNSELAAWSSLCHTLLAGNEFLFLD